MGVRFAGKESDCVQRQLDTSDVEPLSYVTIFSPIALQHNFGPWPPP
jgi:hypothetical protein